MSQKKSIYVDFDGVIHRYDSKFSRIDDIRDGPVDGAIEWLNAMLVDERFNIHMFTTRGHTPTGIAAVEAWMKKYGVVNIEKIKWYTQKPNYFAIIDDRAFAFEGKFPSPEQLNDFKAWNKR